MKSGNLGQSGTSPESRKYIRRDAMNANQFMFSGRGGGLADSVIAKEDWCFVLPDHIGLDIGGTSPFSISLDLPLI